MYVLVSHLEDAGSNYCQRKMVLKGAEIFSSISNLAIKIFHNQDGLG